ncbi:MAG: hypothetical protein ABI351_11975 [Herbaspirillum sp.]
MAKQTGENPKELTDLLSFECPNLLWHVWQMFLSLNQSRSNNGFGASPISYTEMLAWATLTDIRPTPYEVSAIKSLDTVYMAIQAKAAEKARN